MGRWGWPGGVGREEARPVPADSLCPVLRYRKMKERLGLTEIRKQANRMSFGEVGPWDPLPTLPCPLLHFSLFALWPWPPSDLGHHPSLLPGSPAPISPHIIYPAAKGSYTTLSSDSWPQGSPLTQAPGPGTAGLPGCSLPTPPPTSCLTRTSPCLTLPVSSSKPPPGPTETHSHPTPHTQPLSPVSLGSSNRTQLLARPPVSPGASARHTALGPQ